MLDLIQRQIRMEGVSQVEHQDVMGFSCTIEEKDPVNMDISAWVINRELYAQNIHTCRNDENAFRELAYQLQDELLQTQQQNQ